MTFARRFFDFAQDLLNVFESHLCDDGDVPVVPEPDRAPSPDELLRGLSAFMSCRPTHGDCLGGDGRLIACLTIVNTSPVPVEVTVSSYSCEAFLNGREIFASKSSENALGPWTIAPGELDWCMVFESPLSENVIADMRAIHAEAAMDISVCMPGSTQKKSGRFATQFWAPYRANVGVVGVAPNWAWKNG